MYTCQLIAHLSSLKRYGSQTFHNALFIYLRIKNHHTKIFLYMPASHYFFCVTGARTVNSHFCMTNDTTSYEFVYSILFVSYIIKKFLFIIVQLCISSSFSVRKKKRGIVKRTVTSSLKAHAWQQTVEITSRTIIEISMKQNKTRNDSLHFHPSFFPRGVVERKNERGKRKKKKKTTSPG